MRECLSTIKNKDMLILSVEMSSKSCGDGNISRRNTQVCTKRMLEWLRIMKMNRK